MSELQDAVKKSARKVVESLVCAKEPEAFLLQMDRLVRAALATGNVKQLSAQWAYRMLHTPAPLREKMTLFWHGHFATSASKVDDAELMQLQNTNLRRHALGSFGELTQVIARDPAMLLYLDSASNRKHHPNENFARELMELFCLGEGNYTEEDIRELSRCFTGWEIKRKKFRFNRYQHDGGAKTVLSVSGIESGEDAVDVVLNSPHAPRFVVRKLVQFFVMDEPELSDELVEPLALELRANAFQIAPTVQRILCSNLFFSPHARAQKIRSPVEFGVGFLRTLQGTTDFLQLADSMEKLGQGLFLPPSVKGWDGGRSWINSSTLLGRANLIHRLVSGDKTRYGRQSFGAFLESENVRSTNELFNYLGTSLFAIPIPVAEKARVNQLRQTVDDRRWAETSTQALCTLPEFQLA